MKVLSRVDAWIQSAVDFVMFAIMRMTGWGRSAVRYWIATRLCPVVIVIAVATLPIMSVAAALGVGFIGHVLLNARKEKRRDEAAEKAGLAREASPARFVHMVTLSFEIALHGWGYAAFFALQTLLEYAAATPSVPPPLRMAKLATSEAQ